MKIIHLTDTHILGVDRGNLYGLDVALRLKKALKSIAKNHSDAEFLVITGDLVDVATPQAYEVLSSLLDKFSVPVHLIVGNHDNRDYLKSTFPQYNAGKFIQYSKQISGKNFIFLDTLVPGERYGKLCSKRLDWLQKELDKNQDKPTYLFMHHHPVPCGLQEMDTVADFRTAEAFWELLDGYSNVKHIFFGHIHRVVNATKKCVTMHSTRSTAFQVSYLPDTKLEYLTNKENPMYAVVEIDEHDSIRIHQHEYLDEKEYYEDGERFED